MSIGKVRQYRQIVNPKKTLREDLRLKEKSVGVAEEGKEMAPVKPKKQVDTGDSLTPEESRLIRKGEAQLKKGEYVLWDDIKKRIKN